MTDIKRQNYATGQFLTAADFQRDQAYHMGLRRMHNQNLHTPGVASGLAVGKTDDTHVTIAPGMYIDPQGRELVLIDPLVMATDGQKTDGQLYITITYQEVRDPADKIQIGGVDAYVATSERPLFAFTDGGNVPPAGLPLPQPANCIGTVLMQGGKVFNANPRATPAGPMVPAIMQVQGLQASGQLNVAGVSQLAATNVSSLGVGGQATVFGAIYATGCEIQFNQPTHNYSNFSDTQNFASIQNAADYNALMLLGRTVRTLGSPGGIYRVIKAWDYFEVNGTFAVVNGNQPGNVTIAGNLTVNGTAFLHAKSGFVMDRFVNGHDEPLERGDLVRIGDAAEVACYGPDDSIPVARVVPTTEACDTGVCGVVSESFGEAGATGAGTAFSDEERAGLNLTKVAPGQIGHMVTLGAFAFLKVDADIAPIAAGDLLTSSPTKGHAAKVVDRAQAMGAVVGKALKGLRSGKGLIPVLVTLQ